MAYQYDPYNVNSPVGGYGYDPYIGQAQTRLADYAAEIESLKGITPQSRQHQYELSRRVADLTKMAGEEQAYLGQSQDIEKQYQADMARAAQMEAMDNIRRSLHEDYMALDAAKSGRQTYGGYGFDQYGQPFQYGMQRQVTESPASIQERIITREAELANIGMGQPAKPVVQIGTAAATEADMIKSIMRSTAKGESKPGIGVEKAAEEMAKSLVKEMDDAKGAVQGLENVVEAKKLLNSGMITGTGANFLVGLGNLLSSRLGIKFAEDPIANSQTYAAILGKQVGQIIKQFGAGTGLSDADREYAEKIVGGRITLNEKAIRKIIDINERAYINILKVYNKKARKFMQQPGAEDLPFNLIVDIPTETPSKNDPLGIR